MKFKDGRISGVRVIELSTYDDERGSLIETFRSDLLKIKPAMSYVSHTLPGKSRGPHEHRKQTDVFSFIGPGNLKVVLWDNRKESRTYLSRMVITAGKDNPVTLVIPPGVVHGYKNDSSEPGMVINYPDKLYRGYGKKGEVDEVRHEERKNEFYKDFMKL